MTTPSTFTTANRLKDLSEPNMNPRWSAWLATKPETVKNYAYMAWIMARWADFNRLAGRGREAAASTADHLAFDNWLAGEVYGSGEVAA